MQFQDTCLIDFSVKYPRSCEVLLLSYHFVDIFINIPWTDSGMLSRNVWQINESYSRAARTLALVSPSRRLLFTKCWVRIPPCEPLILLIIIWSIYKREETTACVAFSCHGQHCFRCTLDTYSITEIRLQYWELPHTKTSIWNLFGFPWVSRPLSNLDYRQTMQFSTMHTEVKYVCVLSSVLANGVTIGSGKQVESLSFAGLFSDVVKHAFWSWWKTSDLEREWQQW